MAHQVIKSLAGSLSCIAISLAVIAPEVSIAKNNIEKRVDYLEQITQSQQAIGSMQQVTALQEEITELRGQLEAQEHQIKILNSRQEKLFADLDYRISQLQRYKVPNKTYGLSTGEKKVSTEDNAKISSKIDVSSEKIAYHKAYKFIEKKDFKSAETAFQDFLWSYPGGTFAANANYWLGEIYLSSFGQNKDSSYLDKAVEYFSAVTNNHATHQKAADSLLKLGIIAEEQQNYPEAVGYFKKLKEKFPNSSRVTLADTHLEKLHREGRSA